MPKEKEKIDEGIVWPKDDKGERSSTSACKKIWASAFQAIGEGSHASSVLAEKDWRHAYPKHLHELGRLSLKSRENAMAIARAGLKAVRSTFKFLRNGEELPFEEAMEKFSISSTKFHTGSVEGIGAPITPRIEVPLRDKVLTGEDLSHQLDRWAEYGCIEPDAAAAVKSLQAAGSAALPLAGHCYILLGANSELGPLPTLLKMGATVVAVATRRPARWQRLVDLARAAPAGGALLFPVSAQPPAAAAAGAHLAALCDMAGCDLTTDTPELLAWLRSVLRDPSRGIKHATVCCHVYLDGEAHVRASLAMDAIVTALAAGSAAGGGPGGAGGGPAVSAAYLGSPATMSPVPEEAAAAAAARREAAPVWQRLLWPQANAWEPVEAEGGRRIFYSCGYAVVQGPNYALAKTMQMWRAVQLREEAGALASTCMAPSTRTDSMTRSPTMAALLNGQAHFAPLVSFDAATASALMAALLLHDLSAAAAAAAGPLHPANRRYDNPNEVFAVQAVHAGLWRAAWRLESIGAAVVLLGKIWPTHPEGL